MGAKINCSICGKLTDASLDNCPHCGSPVTIGRAPAPPTPIVGGGRTEHCPSCGTVVQEGDIVCVRCGVSLLTGHKVLDDKAESSPGSVRRQPPYALMGVVVLVLVAVAGVAAFFLMRDPVKMARQQAKQGDLPGAVNLLKKHTDSSPDDAGAFAVLGRLYMQMQQYPDAASAFDTASRLSPRDEDLAFQAVIAAGKIQGEAGMERQLAALSRLVESHPENAQAVKMLALAQGAAGNLDKSKGNLERLATLGVPAEEVAKYHGIVDALSGDYPASRTALSTADKSDVGVRAAEGYIASLEGDAFAAADALSAVVTGGQDPDTEAKTRLGLLYMAQGQFSQALPLLRPTEVGRPSDSARFFYALCLQTSGLTDEALTDFELLVSSGGKYAEDAAVQMAMIYLERGQVDQAAEATRKAQKFGSSARLHTLEGSIAALQGAEADAQEQFRTAIRSDDKYPAAHLEQGLMYVRRGVLKEGIRELELYMSLADPAIPGGRLNEVELLIKQLKQTDGNEGATTEVAVAPAPRRVPVSIPAKPAAEAAPPLETNQPTEAAPAQEDTVPLVETPIAVDIPAAAPQS